MKKRNGNPPGIVVHHSLTKDGKTESYNSINKYHIEEMDMDMIGYAFLIEQVGDKVMTIVGRPVDVLGGHTVGHNDMIGICVVGNYDKGQEVLSEEKMEALVNLTKGLMAQFGLSPSQVHRHSEYAPKTCPGSGFPWTDFIGRLSA